MSHKHWEAKKMLDIYIHDYFVRRNLKDSARIFQAEGKVSSDPVAIDAPSGFLYEQWSVYWNTYGPRTGPSHSVFDTSYLETQLAKNRDQQQQPLLHQQNSGTAKVYESTLKRPLQLDSLDDTAIKEMFDENQRQLMDLNHASMLKSSAASGQSSGQVLFGSVGDMSPHAQIWNQPLPGSSQNIKNQMNSVLSPRAACPEGLLFGIPGLTFTEVNSIRASGNKVVCCHFSSDGKLLASGGHDKKVVLWHVDSLKQKRVLQEHLGIITDVRFSSGFMSLATSSFDKTVKVWDAENPSYSLQTFTGHSASVMSLDFHPIKEDLICSCDKGGEMRYWSINNGSCARVFKGGSAHMRFQPRLGRYLAAAAENVVFIFDAETQALGHLLQGHTKPIRTVCWHPTGDFLASLSEDSVKVWSFAAGSEGICVHNLNCNGNKFKSCVFHPTCSPSLLVIGCYQSLDVWNMTENKTMFVSANERLVEDLAASPANGLVASASYEKIVKLWK